MDCENMNTISLNEKVNAILNDRTRVNDIVDIIALLDNTNSAELILRCIQGLKKVFIRFVISDECSASIFEVKGKHVGRKPKDNNDPEEIFRRWLNLNYRNTIEKLLQLLHNKNKEIQEESLSTLMEFLHNQGQKLHKNTDGNIFPKRLFLKIVQNVVDGSSNCEHLIKLFKPYIHYNDISYYLLRSLESIISDFLKVQQENHLSGFSRNIFSLLRLVTIPQSEEDINHMFVTPASGYRSTDSDLAIPNITMHKKIFSATWLIFLSLSMDANIHHQILVILHDKVIPHLVNPKLLMDFLTDSYDIGGVTSILSLNSLFILIHQYNLDYPDFYVKLYSLFNVEIFHMKYCERFFRLADLFLMSTHLPAYLVAAFIKRLSRLALRAPPFGVELLIVFVGNLIKRHPSCKILIHKNKKLKVEDSSEASCVGGDPFIESEPNPAKCKALQSSLWELETLRHHYYPGIKIIVELFDKPFSKNETDLSQYFDSTFETIFEDECVELTKNNAFVEFYVPKKLFSGTMDEMWDMK